MVDDRSVVDKEQIKKGLIPRWSRHNLFRTVYSDKIKKIVVSRGAGTRPPVNAWKIKVSRDDMVRSITLHNCSNGFCQQVIIFVR